MMETDSTTILVVDDHPMVRLGLTHLLQSHADWQVCEATCQQDASVVLRENKIDLAIVDISLPDGSGLELIRNQKAHHRSTRWLVLSVYYEPYYQMRARTAGAHGFLSKRAVQSELVQAVTALLDGKDFPEGFQTRVSERSDLESLTEREMTIFRLIAEGATVEQIANSLSRSRKTINAIRDRIRAKLNISSSQELSRYATQWYFSLDKDIPHPIRPMKWKNKPDSKSQLDDREQQD